MSKEKKLIILIILAIVVVVGSLIFLEKKIEKRNTEAKVAEIIEKENQKFENSENINMDESANINNTFIGIPIEEIEGDSIERNLNMVEKK